MSAMRKSCHERSIAILGLNKGRTMMKDECAWRVCIHCGDPVKKKYALYNFREQPACFTCIFDFTINGQVIRIRDD